jgi:hypothetical protein
MSRRLTPAEARQMVGLRKTVGLGQCPVGYSMVGPCGPQPEIARRIPEIDSQSGAIL